MTKLYRQMRLKFILISFHISCSYMVKGQTDEGVVIDKIIAKEDFYRVLY